LDQGLVFYLNHFDQAMRNRFSYFLEMSVLIPVFPILYILGKKLKNDIIKLPSRSEYLKIETDGSKPKLLIIGESTAAGVGASSKETTFASQIFKHTGEKFAITNIGENGLKAENLQGLYKKLEGEIGNSFSKAIILIGANDCFKLTSPWKFKRELEIFSLFLIKEKNVENITIPLIPPVHEFPLLPAIMRFFLGWHRNILTAELESLEKSVSQISFDNHKSKTSEVFYSEDGIHPSDYGYELIALAIAENIK
jgi:lysophospholipase L1-like esterase